MFEGKLVRLRAYRKEDMDEAYNLVNDLEVRGFLNPGIPYPLKREEEDKFYENLSSSKDTYSFAIERIEDKRYIGGCGVNEVNWKNSNCCVGIFLGKPYWSYGYGTEAMQILVDFIFKEMNIHKIFLCVYSFNERAIKSYEKLGFKVEGRLREHIFRFGKYHDEIIMGILRSEYQ
ncbi:MAG: GNAT family N-acetyltransferase [Petrotogales bacterium]